MNENTALMNLADTERLGNIFVKSGFFADARQEAQAIVKILAGRELGLGPIASMTGIYVVQGRIALGANVIAAIIKRSGRYDFRVLEISDATARIEFFEIVNNRRESLGISVFTAEDAKKAGTQNMAKFARNMLYARCLTNGARWYCPDVYAGGIYTPEEMGAIVDGDGEVLDVTPQRTSNPEPAPAPTANADPEPPSDAEFRKLTSATEERAEQSAAGAKANGRAMASLQLGGQIAQWNTWVAGFADIFPYYAISGKADIVHILRALASEGFPIVTPENLTDACKALEVRAERKAAGK